jgi:hypothetical protein
VREDTLSHANIPLVVKTIINNDSPNNQPFTLALLQNSYSLNNNLELTKCSKQRNATQAENNIHSFTQFYIKSLKKKNRSDMNSHVQLCHYCFSNSI